MPKSRRAKATAISQETHDKVFIRDGGCCVYCGRRYPWVFPEAHFISRKKGGLGIPENLLTLCRECHDRYDHGTREEREGMREFFREYFRYIYPDWDESKLIYHKYGRF